MPWPNPTAWSESPAQGPRTPKVLVAVSLTLLLLGVAALSVVVGLVVVSFAYGRMEPIKTWVTADASVDAGTVHINGTANLPDGAELTISVYDVEGARPELEGAAVIHNGTFSFDADVTSLPAGPASVGYTFVVDPRSQPLNVLLTYGPTGERLAGDQVLSDSGDVYLEDGVDFDIPRQ